MYQHENVNSSTMLNNHQCAATGQSLHYDSNQQTAFNSKSKKRFFTSQQSDQTGELANADPLAGREHIQLGQMTQRMLIYWRRSRKPLNCGDRLVLKLLNGPLKKR